MFEVPQAVDRFVNDLVNEVQAPRSLKERNWVQLVILERVRRNFDGLDPIDTLVCVARRFNHRFPQS